MSEVTFLDGLDYCDVHGHDAEFIDLTILDIVGNEVKLERCRRCKKEKETLVESSQLRTSETRYPKGVWI